MNIHTCTEDGIIRLSTCGLHDEGLPELRLQLADHSLIDDAHWLLQTTISYMRDQHRVIKPDETMSFGYWGIKFHGASSSLELWEFDDEWNDVVPGAERALRFWHDQAEVCRSVGAAFHPPLATTMAAVSSGVLDGQAVDGIRYPSPSHMSGWYLTTDLYNGDINTMSVIHLHHVTHARPDLARYLALPFGYFFDLRCGLAIGFREDVAAEEP